MTWTNLVVSVQAASFVALAILLMPTQPRLAIAQAIYAITTVILFTR
jgi:hypothetical protein